MPVAAKYECEAGYKMHLTMKDNWGWCRRDGSFEVPRCEREQDFYKLEFKLDNGNVGWLRDPAGRVHGGLVLVRPIGTNGITKRHAESEWTVACNDGVNDFAAGAVCRTLGFKHGKVIPATQRMMTSENRKYEFGWTKFNCRYDDTLPQSHYCKAKPYHEALEEEGMKAACFDFDRGAVECFDSAVFNVHVEVAQNKRGFFCRSWGEKEGNLVRLGAQLKGLHVKWRKDGEADHTAMQTRYRGSRGKFVAIARVKNWDEVEYNCMTCELYLGDRPLGYGKHCKERDDSEHDKENTTES